MAKKKQRAEPEKKGMEAKQDEQTRGQFERDPKGRKGHYTGAGEPPPGKK